MSAIFNNKEMRVATASHHLFGKNIRAGRQLRILVGRSASTNILQDVMVAWTNVIIRFASALVIVSATRFSQQLGLKH